MHRQTPSQTIGPFFAVMRPLGSNRLVPEGHEAAIRVTGTLFDGEGTPVVDGLIEVWQADESGHYPHLEDPHFRPGIATGYGGFGRCATDSTGQFSFVTVKPGQVPGYDERMQAPHIVVSVFARGLLRRLVTRLYFPDELHANANDPVLSSIADDAVRTTLIAEPSGDRNVRFDIHLRGERETAFFAV